MKKKKLLMAMGTMAIAAMLISAGTFALFTAEAVNEGNTFATGTLTIEDITNGNGSAAFKVANMAPGDKGNGELTIKNTGSLDAWVKVDSVDTEGALFSGDNPIELKYSSDTVEVKSGESQVFKVSYQFPLAAGNEYQGKDGSATFNFKAVQSKNNPGQDWN